MSAVAAKPFVTEELRLLPQEEKGCLRSTVCNDVVQHVTELEQMFE